MCAKTLIPPAVAVLVVAAMAWQGRESEPTLCEAPAVRLVELPGYESEALPASESELHTLPADTSIDKRRYESPDGSWYAVTVVVGGRSKSSIHRPEMCLPSQGFQMMDPRRLEIAGEDWHVLTVVRRDAPPLSFAYTFLNQEGFRTSSHVSRIFRDVWDRSINGRIDRWAMVTITGCPADVRRLEAFVARLEKDVLR